MTDAETVMRFVLAATVGVAAYTMGRTLVPYRAPSRPRAETPSGARLPGGKGNAFGQRMGRRKTGS